jgi:DNA-binding SARP family transcriptional activator
VDRLETGFDDWTGLERLDRLRTTGPASNDWSGFATGPASRRGRLRDGAGFEQRASAIEQKEGEMVDGEQRERAEVLLVGGFEMRIGGRRINLPTGTQRLIGFLALHGRPARRSYVSGRLWPEATENRAAACLRSALWRLPVVDVAPVVASASHLSLIPDLVVDIDRLRADGLAAVDGRVPDERLLETARKLCAADDDILAGWYDDWITTDREKLRQLRLHALERLGDRLLTLRWHHDALQVGLSCVAADPIRESGHRLVMRAHLDAGNIADVIGQYRRFARLLDDELGVLPSPAMQTLYRECLGEPLRRSA